MTKGTPTPEDAKSLRFAQIIAAEVRVEFKDKIDPLLSKIDNFLNNTSRTKLCTTALEEAQRDTITDLARLPNLATDCTSDNGELKTFRPLNFAKAAFIECKESVHGGQPDRPQCQQVGGRQGDDLRR